MLLLLLMRMAKGRGLHVLAVGPNCCCRGWLKQLQQLRVLRCHSSGGSGGRHEHNTLRMITNPASGRRGRGRGALRRRRHLNSRQLFNLRCLLHLQAAWRGSTPAEGLQAQRRIRVFGGRSCRRARPQDSRPPPSQGRRLHVVWNALGRRPWRNICDRQQFELVDLLLRHISSKRGCSHRSSRRSCKRSRHTSN